jgi:hypothetical protein
MNIRVILPQLVDDLGDMPHDARFSGSDVNIAFNAFFLDGKLRLRLFNHVHNLFRALAQAHPVRRQGNAVAVPHKKFGSQLFLKLFDLPGKRRLRHMQKIRRPRHAPLSGDRQKIPQYP